MLKNLLTVHNLYLKYNKRFFCHDVVNLGILAHIDAGKTTISEDILYNSNEIRVKGNINDQNTQLDFLKQERERGITIKTAYSCFKWNNVNVNLIDTPGHIDFSNETFLSLCVSDKCVIVIDAKEGLQIQTLNIFRYIKENIPIYFFLNKMDINEIDIDYNFNSLKNGLSKKSILITYPIYENKKLKYILDLPSMYLYYYPQIKYGQKLAYKNISLANILKTCNHENINNHFFLIEPCIDIAETDKSQDADNILNILNNEIIDYIIKKREELVEFLCDLDNQIEYKYLNNIPIKYDILKNSLIKYINMRYIFPIFSGSALNSYGIHILLDYITHNVKSEKNIYLSEKKYENITLHPIKNDDEKCKNNFNISNETIFNKIKNNNNILNKKYDISNIYKTILFIFKLVNEKNGYNTFCKVLKGNLLKNSKLCNIRNHKYELVKSIYKIKADRYIMTNELNINDIGMIRGFGNIQVCDIMYEMNESISSMDKEKLKKDDNSYTKKEKKYKNINELDKVEVIKNISDNVMNNCDNKWTGNTELAKFNEVYRIFGSEIKNKGLWYFLKSYKKRISKNIIVCTCSIEPKDYRKEKELKKILNDICIEDNSIISYTDKNNKLIIGSIGILNIEVTLDKIKSDYKIDIKTDDVEIVQKEYILGNYEDTIKKEIKINSKFSSILIGLSIKEKEFVDVSKYIQNILKCDDLPEPLLYKNKTSINVNYSYCEDKNKNKTPKYSFIKNNSATYYNNSKIRTNINNSIILDSNINEVAKTESKFSDISELSIYRNLDNTDNILGEKDESDQMNDYLLNFNYDDLFQSTVLIDKNVETYIENLKKRDKKNAKFYDDILNSCITTLKNCLSNGYRTNGSIISTEVKIIKLEIPDDCTLAVAKYACNDLYYQIIRKANICIAEPITLIQIQTHESFIGAIVKNLVQHKNGTIIQIMKNKEHNDFKIMKIIALIPVKHTSNYASVLRSISSGHADFFMTFCGYKKI
ncbi:tetQ family GTPase, putative [Plasmodium berghei]|uniref:TetQ family GTPase, putative n=3 Tax=Plasmodium berghei TaxID=5821 RepID=A0A509AV91_PLABA|nr:tetQ family GTPase, putative [Plasmodium berghei ANKA]SCN28680.1 tetQ family GTPase, putative [Plasmodium berghei]SCO62909.1 tetQ family GTPase, putative [Plasmodium berghei]SCO64428.1 tetQ family GTPase, putative [Plasmodium berghei]VUC58562.1 tetQ family GTPase, putative [Plasmodium berghei ANKA]|eukprot:XP_034424325.1 tetQ family GTPase, putative [Plasmodium berghei ANKA]